MIFDEESRIEIQLDRFGLYCCLHGDRFVFSFRISNWLWCYESKTTKWIFGYQLRWAFGCVGFEWIDQSKSCKWKKPITKYGYWGLGKWKAMTDKEYEEWRAKHEQCKSAGIQDKEIL